MIQLSSLTKAFGDRVEASRKIRGRNVHFTFVRGAAAGSADAKAFDLLIDNGATVAYDKLKDRATVLVRA